MPAAHLGVPAVQAASDRHHRLRAGGQRLPAGVCCRSSTSSAARSSSSAPRWRFAARCSTLCELHTVSVWAILPAPASRAAAAAARATLPGSAVCAGAVQPSRSGVIPPAGWLMSRRRRQCAMQLSVSCSIQTPSPAGPSPAGPAVRALLARLRALAAPVSSAETNVTCWAHRRGALSVRSDSTHTAPTASVLCTCCSRPPVCILPANLGAKACIHSVASRSRHMDRQC